jgi:hypothetical protein
LERIAKKIQTGRAGLQECVMIYQFIQRVPAFSECFKATLHPNKTLLDQEFSEKFEILEKV